METENTLRTYDEVTSPKTNVMEAHKLNFILANGDCRDIYNPTAPFQYKDEEFLMARVEDRPLQNAESYFFRKRNDCWEICKELPSFSMEDPFYKKVGDEHILGGVVVADGKYSTVLMRSSNNDLSNLKPFFQGPVGMKDIRLLTVNQGGILVLTRPQKGIYGRGQIGYFTISDLSQLTVENILSAKILHPQFISEEWGGVNEAHLLQDGSVGLLSHIAKYSSDGNRHYAATTFRFSPDDETFTPMEILAERKFFLPGPAKRPDLKDVVFPGGLIRNDDGTASLFAGISDAETQELILPDPFRKWE